MDVSNNIVNVTKGKYTKYFYLKNIYIALVNDV